MTKKIKTIRRPVQKCALCGRAGHNRRKCPNKKAVFVVKEKKTKESEKKKNYEEKSSFIKVNTMNSKISPHVIDFNQKSTGHWEKINVYQEPKIKMERRSLNFSEMVKSANQAKTDYKEKDLPKINVHRRIQTPKISSKVKNYSQKKTADLRQGIKNGLDIKNRLSFQFNFKSVGLLAVFLIMVLVLPFPAISYYQTVQKDTAEVVEKSTAAFLSLQSSTVAALQNNIEQAKFDLNSALNSFSEAENILDKEYGALLYVAKALPVVGVKINSRQNLLLAGHHLALGNSYLVKGIDSATKETEMNISARLGILGNHLKSALPQYEEALEDLNRVESDSLPYEYQASYGEFKLLFATFIDDMRDMEAVMGSLQSIIGGKSFKRYLVVFQNNHEIRPTGGFMGSFAVIDMQKGKIENIDLPGGGSYDLQGQLDIYLKPPLPLQLINQRWYFHDANWFPDFSASAEKMAWFYRHSRNNSVDGVIAVNASVLERLLKVMGPVYNEQFELLVNSEDALEKIQNEVENDYDQEKNQPKEVLSSLLEQLIQSLQNLPPEALLSLLTELNASLQEKEIQAYFTDVGEQEKIRDFGWTGELAQTNKNQDYLFVVNTNLGGGKSDKKIEQTVEHQAVIQDDGSVVATVMITRKHEGQIGEQFYGDPNINYLRIYVPEGAELLEAGGFSFPEEESFLISPDWYEEDDDLLSLETEKAIHVKSGTRITNEFNKTAFGNWVFTEPSETSQIYFTYKLPFVVFEDLTTNEKFFDKITNNEKISRYSLYLQKQSGMTNKFISTIIYPNGWQPVWKASEEMKVSVNGAKVEGELSTDKVWGLVMQKNNEK